MTLRLLKRTVLSLSLIVMTLSCSEHRDEKILLADSLSLARPDSAMAIMDSIGQTKDRLSRSERMYYELIRAKVQNRAYVDFTTDSVMLEVADYYDHHGTANERMLAHYLLGCTYRDLKEAPMSLQCYYDAVEAADTLSSDCDYSTLMSIWGQIASILDSQGFPLEELEAWSQYKKYAIRNCDSLYYIIGIERQARAYNLLGDTTNILKMAQESSELYKKHGYTAQSAIAIFNEIPININRGNYVKAKQLMDLFERESGYFDASGNVIKGKEGYSRYKGLYYEGIGKLDSAEFFYRQLFKYGYDFDGCTGLSRIYAKTRNVDSLARYSLMKDDCFDKVQSRLYTQTMHQRKGMYDYSRNQKKLLLKENEALRNKSALIIVSFLLLILCIVTIYLYVYFKRKKEAELSQLGNKYFSSIAQLRKIEEEQELMKSNYQKLQSEKEAEAVSLKKQIGELEECFSRINTQEKVSSFINSALVSRFRKYGQTGLLKEKPSERDWNDLEEGIGKCIPSLSIMINQGNILPLDRQVIILTYLGFSAKEISVIIEKSASRISNIKAIANEKLFNQRDARTLFKNLRNTTFNS